MNHIIFKLIEMNEQKAAEARDVGLGTVHAVTIQTLCVTA